MATATITTTMPAQVTVPATHISIDDLLDVTRDRLRTIHLALSPENECHHDKDSLFAVWASLDHAIIDLDLLRGHFDKRD